MKTHTISVTVNGETQELTARKLKYRERMRIAGILRKGVPAPEQEVDEEGKPKVDEKGSPVFKDQSMPFENVAEYQVALIQTCICNDAGAPFYTVDEIDEWSNDRIRETAAAIEKLNKADENGVEEARGNSSKTEAGSSSSN